MWSDQQWRAIRAISEDTIRSLEHRSLYRIVNVEEVGQNLFRRLEKDSRLEQLYREGKPAAPEIVRQAHFAFFEQVHILLRSGRHQHESFEELARYFYQRAIVCIYALAPQYINSTQELAHIEFKPLALEASQAAVVEVYERFAWTGGIADPSNFYTYAKRTIWKHCMAILSQQATTRAVFQVSSGSGGSSGSRPRIQFNELSSLPQKDAVRVTRQKGWWDVLMETTRVLVDQDQRDIATLFLVGLDHNKIAALLGRPDSEVVASISKLLQNWSSDVSLQDRLRSSADRE